MLANAVTDAPRLGYADPVNRLLTVGDANLFKPIDWPDYPGQYGFGPEHAAELIRMACDRSLHLIESDGPEIWAPIHAWRALAQLHAVEAVEPLVEFMKTPLENDISVSQEFAEVFGRLGPGAIAALASVLDDRTVDWLPASLAGGGLTKIVKRHPECRDECVAILGRVLEHAADTDPWIVGDVIGYLLTLKAVETIDAIREAFRIDAVDITICGDLEDVEIDLGLREHRDTPKPHYGLLSLGGAPPEPPSRLSFYDSDLEWSDVRRAPKIGRNDPCPCGSGRKFKKCCLNQNDFLSTINQNGGTL
jgi:SEC-C motif/Protein of unknown function (DUF1186)